MEKSIEQHLHANERSCCGCCFVMRACKDSTSICMKQFVKATHHCGPQGGGGEGTRWVFCKDGAMTLVNKLSVHFPLN